MIAARLLIAVAAAAALASAPGPRAAQAATPRDSVRDIIVARAPGLTGGERRALRAEVDGVLVDTLRIPDTEVIRVPARGLQSALAELNADPDVRFAEPDAPVRASVNDTYWTRLWGLNNPGGLDRFFTERTADADIDADDAWKTTTGTGVVVAVVDSGTESAHPDLGGQITGNPGERGAGREANGVDDDRNGLVDDWQGWDFVAGGAEADDRPGADNAPGDANGHGTHVAGTIAAAGDNGEGVVGVAYGARVMPLRVLDADGAGSTSALAEAFDYAGDLGVRVVNASLGGPIDSFAVREAIRAHPSTLYVAAAGNGGSDGIGDNVDTYREYPCATSAPNVVCVGATDSRDARGDFSNYGATTVDLFAPGVDIASTYLTSGSRCSSYCHLDGTSMATPHAAGAAALVAAALPALDGAAIRQRLIATADRRSGLTSVAGGRLNAATAVAAAAPTSPAPTPTPSPAPAPAPAPGPTPTPSPAPTPPAVVQPPQPPAPGTVPDVRPPAARLSASRRTVVLRRSSVGVTIRSSRAVAATMKVTRRGSRAVLLRRSASLKRGATTVKLARRLPGRKLRAGSYAITVSAPGAADLRITLLVR